MDKKPLIGVNILAVVLLVIASLTNVVGYQTVQSSNQSVIKERINQRELLFQTIVDIANNKEIQRIILKSQMSRGLFPPSEIPIVTKTQIRQMYFIGLILSKIIDKSKLYSLMKQNQIIPSSAIQKQITAIIEKNTKLSREITQLSNLDCQCENQSIRNQNPFPLICGFLLFLLCVPAFFLLITITIAFPLVVIDTYVDNPVVTLLMAICAIPLIIWLPVFFAIGMVMLEFGCYGLGFYPPLGL